MVNKLEKLEYGIKSDLIKKLIKFLNAKIDGDHVFPVSTKVFEKNLVNNEIKGIGLLKSKVMEDGIYLCAAFQCRGFGHCFVLEILEGKKLIHDSSEESVKSIEDYGKWVFDWSFVRKVEIFHKSNKRQRKN